MSRLWQGHGTEIRERKVLLCFGGSFNCSGDRVRIEGDSHFDGARSDEHGTACPDDEQGAARRSTRASFFCGCCHSTAKL